MTRLFTDGAEFGDMLFWTNPAGNAASTTQKRSGAYSYKIGAGRISTKYFTNKTEVYGRFGIYIVNTDLSDILRLYSNNGNQIEASMRWNSGTGFIRFMKEVNFNVPYCDTFVPITPGEWNLIEFYLKIHSSTGAAAIKINGVLASNQFSGNTQYSNSYIDTFALLNNYGSEHYFDDLALNDTDNSDGKNDNSWCGEGKIELLSPNGNGSLNEWTGSDADSTDNYALVDEIPASSSDYVEDSTAGHKDKYALTDFTSTGKQILRVWPECRAIDTVPEGAQIKIGVRTNGADYMSAAKSLSTSYSPVKGDEYKLNPDDSAQWEDADLDGLELVLETV